VKFKLGKEKRIDLNYSVGYVKTSFVTFEEGIELECNKELKPISIAYQTYGKLNEDKSNAVLVGHALSGDAHAARLVEYNDRPWQRH
jgi:homoserine O-acetyltransferase